MLRSPAWRLSCAGLTAVMLASTTQAQVAPSPLPMAAQLEKLRAQLDEQRALIDKLSSELEQIRGVDEGRLAGERGTGQAPAPATAPPVPPQPVAAQAQRPAVAAGAAQKEQVGQPPRKDSRPPEVAPLFEAPGILTQRGKYILEPSVQYGYSSNNRVALVGYTIIPALLIGLIDVREVKRNTLTGSLAFRTGLSNRLEVEARVPYVYRSDSTVSRELFTGTAVERVFATSGRDVGDAEIAARYQLNNGGADKPYYVGGVRIKSRTGKDPFEVVTDCATRCVGQNATGTGLPLDLPTGSGFYSVQPSLTWLFPSDPAIFFGTVSYTHNFKRNDVSRTVLNGEKELLGDLKPGDVVGFNFGMGLALNEKASVSIGYDHSSVGRMKQDGIALPGSVRTQLGTLLVGYSYRLSDKRSLNVSVGAGVTRDTPDVSLTLRMPIGF
ncbi:MAG: acetate kinase [Telluria sp.]